MRRARIHYPGATYHAMARGVDGRETFADDRDRELFLTALAELKREMGFSLFAYCLMGNHFHLAIKVGHIPLSNVLQRLLTRYALTFNARHDRTGHLFQARYKAVLCVNEKYLLTLVAYIHANPIRSGLSATAEDWPWSSAGSYAKSRRTDLVDPFALPEVLGLTQSGDFDPWPNVAAEPALLRTPTEDRISLESLANRTATLTGLPIEAIRSRRRDAETLRGKRIFAVEGLKAGYYAAVLARWMGCTPTAVLNLARHRDTKGTISLTLKTDVSASTNKSS